MQQESPLGWFLGMMTGTGTALSRNTYFAKGSIIHVQHHAPITRSIWRINLGPQCSNWVTGFEGFVFCRTCRLARGTVAELRAVSPNSCRLNGRKKKPGTRLNDTPHRRATHKQTTAVLETERPFRCISQSGDHWGLCCGCGEIEANLDAQTNASFAHNLRDPRQGSSACQIVPHSHSLWFL